MPSTTPITPNWDNAIREVYGQVDSAVEPILTSRSRRDDFIAAVQKLLPEASEDAILESLVRLRKRGEKKGGLPRKGK